MSSKKQTNQSLDIVALEKAEAKAIEALNKIQEQKKEYNSPINKHARLEKHFQKHVDNLIAVFEKENFKFSQSIVEGNKYSFSFENKDLIKAKRPTKYTKYYKNSKNGKFLDSGTVKSSLSGQKVLKTELKKLFPEYDVDQFCRNFKGKTSGGGGVGKRKLFHIE